MSDDKNIFTYCMKELKKRINGIEINANTIIKVLKFSMEVVETSKLKGPAQRELAIKLVRQVVVDAPITDEKEKLLIDLIDNGILSNTVDLVVEATNGEVDINTVVKVTSGCCATFLKSRNN